MTNWQPIETAPDETYIIVFVSSFMFPVIAAYSSEHKVWSDGEKEIPEPAHWMPLPEPPK